MKRILVPVLVLVSVSFGASNGPGSLLLAQASAQRVELVPGTRYDSAIPTLQQVVGHSFREEITSPENIVRYFEALAQAAPRRTQLIHYAQSWEGRDLVILVIGSRQRISRLDEVKADLHRLADPRGLSTEQGQALLSRLPVVTALMHGVHGNEISSNGAAMAEAYHLLAAQNDPRVDKILAESLVLIDPAENPDGRARFVFQNSMGRSRWPDPESLSAEHDEPWPGGRVNHYLFDLNRDLFIQSQPETRGKVRVLLDYSPQIVADLHEMGGDSTYFFPPTAPPVNPWFTQVQVDLMDVFGRANARAFDERGFAYFNRDVYDMFYPGYVDMWPTSQGALGMTYEQASARALVLRQSDGDLLTYGDGVLHHFTAALTTAYTAAVNREQILKDYLEFRRDGIARGSSGPAELLLYSDHDGGMAERLARMLVRNGIEVHRATRDVTLEGRNLAAAATFVIPMAQPAHRFVHSLLDKNVPMDEDFIRRQIERRANRQRDEIYDLTAWSQSLLWDVEVVESNEVTGAAGDPVSADPNPPRESPLPRAQVGYLLPWGTNAAATVIEALREGIRVHSSGGEFSLGGRDYPVGTAIVRTPENGPDLPQRLGTIAARHGAEVIPIDDSYVSQGTSLGSRAVRTLREPRVLLVYDEPGSTYSVGWARFVLERRYGQRTSVIRASTLGRVNLSNYDVVIFPSGNYRSVVGGGLLQRLQTWMREGGTLITLAEATRWVSREDGLLATKAERRGGRPEGTDAARGGTSQQPIDYLEEIVPADEAPEQVPGSILTVLLDTHHWLAAGTDGKIGALVEGSRVFQPITLDRGINVGRYGELDDLVLSGVVWEESRPQLASKAFLIYQPMGRGQLIAFAEDPNYRAYTEATELLFINAVLLGPGR